MDERHNEKRYNDLGHEVDVDPVRLRAFKLWQKNVYAKEYALMDERKRAAQGLVEADASIVCEKSDYNGETIPRLSDMKTASKGSRYGYLLKLSGMHPRITGEPIPLDEEVAKAWAECEADPTHDAAIRNSDAYKKL